MSVKSVGIDREGIIRSRLIIVTALVSGGDGHGVAAIRNIRRLVELTHYEHFTGIRVGADLVEVCQNIFTTWT